MKLEGQCGSMDLAKRDGDLLFLQPEGADKVTIGPREN